jgi:hypothetical protein
MPALCGSRRLCADDTRENCAKGIRRNIDCGFDHVHPCFLPNQINSRGPRRARWSGGRREPASRPDRGRDRVLPGWAGQVCRNRGRAGRLEQWSRAALSLEPVFLLPLAAGYGWNEPSAKSPARCCPLEWGDQRRAMVLSEVAGGESGIRIRYQT